jgi:poly(3-hydroxybutyrate) depolymerase
MTRHILIALLSLICAGNAVRAAKVASTELRAGNDQDKQYFLITPANLKAPPGGHALLLILPGGDGAAAFNPFCQGIAANACSDGFVVAQLVAKRWNDKQEIVWPTATNKVPGQKFTTEQFIDAVTGDVKAKHKIDDRRIYALAWSSGGPAVYAATLKKDSPIDGAFVAMSVFNPRFLPPLDAAKGKAFYIYHSPEDKTCPIRMAEAADKQLAAKGAKTNLVKYAGGHGWHGDVFGDVRVGIDWLEKQR